jgi:hypothetical protein
MEDMIEALEPNVAAIATNTSSERLWQRRICVMPLDHRGLDLYSRAASKLGFQGRAYNRSFSLRRVHRAVSCPSVSKIFGRYADFALQFNPSLENYA